MLTGNRTLRRVIPFLLALVIVAAACGSSDDSAEDVATPTTTATASAGAEETNESAGDAAVTTAAPAPTAAPGVDPRSLLDQRVFDATTMWGTDWSMFNIDLGELALGIGSRDPRDIIRPIDQPVFASLDETAEWLTDREPGALVEVDGERRFYPLGIMTRHEIVNDEFGDVPVAVTYCPLCNTAVSYDRRVDGSVIRLGVSGLLRNSDMVMWDRDTDSLWQQITGEGIVGTFTGTRLETVSTAIVSFGEVRENFPDAIALAQNQGFGTSYGINPYTNYSSQAAPIPGFADLPTDTRLQPLERVIGVSINDEHVAYPFAAIEQQRVIADTVGGEPVVVLWGGDTADALGASVIREAAAIGTGVAYLATVDGEVLSFSAAGDDTFTDDQTGSTWTLLGRATDGPLQGSQLETANHRNEFWFAFAFFFPEARIQQS